MDASIAVVTDSAASLPDALVRKWGIRVVPLQVIVDGDPHDEGVSIAPDAVLEALVAGRDVSTSQPSVAAFEEAYRAAQAAGATGVAAVLISSHMSGTFNGARAAAEAVEIPVELVDTETLAMATGFAALAAAAAARSGASLSETAQAARDVAASTTCVFTVDTLEFLRKGGRVSPAVAAVGKVLGVRPVLEMRGGEVALVDRVRTTARARDAVMARAADAVKAAERPAAAVMALGEAEFGDDAARALEVAHPEMEMLVRTPVSAVLAVHTGPGTLAAVVADLPPGIA